MAKSKSGASKKKASAGKTPQVKIDKALKAAWQVQLDRLREARSGAMSGWDEQYEALGAILDGQLYLAGGYANARAFLRKEFPDLDERSAYGHIAVAQHFDPEDEEKYGPTRLRLLLEYLAAAGGSPVPPAKIHPERQRVIVPVDKSEKRVPFPETTTQQLQEAIRHARGGKSQARKAAPPIVKTLAAALAKKKVRGVGVSVRGDLVVLSIPRARIADALAALAKVRVESD